MKPTPTEVITPGEIVNPLSSGKGTYSGGWTSTCKTSDLDGKDADKERIMSRRASLQDFQNRQGCLPNNGWIDYTFDEKDQNICVL